MSGRFAAVGELTRSDMNPPSALKKTVDASTQTDNIEDNIFILPNIFIISAFLMIAHFILTLKRLSVKLFVLIRDLSA